MDSALRQQRPDRDVEHLIVLAGTRGDRALRSAVNAPGREGTLRPPPGAAEAPELEVLAGSSGAAALEQEVLGLVAINRRLLGPGELRGLLGTIVGHAVRVSGAERGLILVEKRGRGTPGGALEGEAGDGPDVEPLRAVARRALRSMTPLSVGPPDGLGRGPRSVLCAPFAAGAELRGALVVDHRFREAAFGERAEHLLALLADQAGLALRHAYQADEIARLGALLGGPAPDGQHGASPEGPPAGGRAPSAPEPPSEPDAQRLVGDSAPMRAVRGLLERVAPTALPVLVVGETGTGKELAARSLHALSGRRRASFLAESCAALPATLIDSELFGHRRGAFTGAAADRAGLFERADGGTLFLDEIGELPLELQAKLLRVLETGEVRRVGDSAVRRVDVRLVAATNRDLEAEVAAGRFRPDLLFRLRVVVVRMPSLAERPADVPALVEHFLAQQRRRTGQHRTLAPGVLERLRGRSWPGNVRELANELAAMWALSDGALVDRPRGASPPASSSPVDPEGEAAVLPLEQVERRAIEAALAAVGGSKTRAAELLGISRAKIYLRLKKWRQEALAGGA